MLLFGHSVYLLCVCVKSVRGRQLMLWLTTRRLFPLASAVPSFFSPHQLLFPCSMWPKKKKKKKCVRVSACFHIKQASCNRESVSGRACVYMIV